MFWACFAYIYIFIYLQVQRVLNHLYENKKIASATHNIYAYRYFCFNPYTDLQLLGKQ